MKFLHLEDSDNDAALIEAVLQETWPECRIERVVARTDFDAALTRGGFDVILSDFALPDFDGLSALDMARIRCPGIPFIFISGTIGEERAIDALKRGAADYIVKDRPGRLGPAIQQALSLVRESEQRRRADEEARLSNERFRLVARATNDAVWDWDLAKGTIWWSESYELLFGHSRIEDGTLQVTWTTHVHPEDAARVQAGLEKALHNGESFWRSEYRFRRADSSYAEVLDRGYVLRDAEGKAHRMIGSLQDVTDHNEDQRKIRSQAELLDKARDAIMLTDLADRIIYWNQSAERITGWSAADAIGNKLEALFGAAIAPRAAGIRATVETTDAWDGEVTIVNRTGRTVMLEMRITLIRDGAGHPLSRLSLCSDITEKRRLESEVQRAERLDSIGMLAGGVAHDLNNSFAPIMMAVELLRSRVSDPQCLRMLEMVWNSAEHGAALVKQLLAFARGTGAAERAPVDLSQSIEVVRQLLRASLPRSVELVVQVGQVRPILGDTTELKQVLLNLCLNARDAMPEGGKIEVSADNVEVDATLARAHPGAVPGPHVRLRVRDTGSGIPTEVIDRIFDPFFTTKPVGKGTGLGLSMVAGIVRSHGGFQRVESAPGKGALFELFLPAMPETAGAHLQNGMTLAAEGAGEHLLLIDDDATVRDLCRQLLEQAGYRVTAADNGDNGVETFRRAPAAFAVVITDLIMPGLSGLEIIAAVRQLSAQQPMIVVSGLLDAERRRQVSAFTPAVECLMKPVSADALLRAVKAAVGGPAQAPR